MKKVIKGTVVSTKLNKAVVVQVNIVNKHTMYSRPVKSTKRYLVKDEVGVIEGDTVLIEESRPFGKRVTWVVKERVMQ